MNKRKRVNIYSSKKKKRTNNKKQRKRGKTEKNFKKRWRNAESESKMYKTCGQR